MENFDFSSLLEFPGILVLIGVVLLIVAIIIAIASKKTSTKKQKYMEQPIAVEPVSQMPANELPPILNNMGMENQADFSTGTMPMENNQMPNFGQPTVTQQNVASTTEMPQPSVIQPVVQPQPTAYGGVNPMDAINANMGVNHSEIKQEDVVPSIVAEPTMQPAQNVSNEDVETL